MDTTGMVTAWQISDSRSSPITELSLVLVGNTAQHQRGACSAFVLQSAIVDKLWHQEPWEDKDCIGSQLPRPQLCKLLCTLAGAALLGALLA